MLVEFSIYPMGEMHMSQDVAKVIQILESTGLDYRLGPMSTSIEGNWDEVMTAVQRCHEAIVQAGHSRIITNISIDDRKDQPVSLNDAVSRVENRLGHPVKH